MDTDFEIYKSKKFSSLLKDVVVNSERKRAQVDLLISELRLMIKSPNDAITIVPLIKEYLDVGVKNDEQLVKLAAIVQRLAAAQTGDDNALGVTEEERKALLAEADKITKDVNIPIDIKPSELIPI
jgi:hypothetical protein